jgi:uncharacterized protein (TIGR03435 family)
LQGRHGSNRSRYQLQAKLPVGAATAQIGLMLQSLLGERFGLAAHRETREVAAYELTFGKSGPKLKPSNAAGEIRKDNSDMPIAVRFAKGADGLPDFPPGVDVPRTYAVVLSGSDGVLYKVWGRHETMAQLADRLSAQLDRPVVDATGLEGEYDFNLTFAVETAGGPVSRKGPPPDQIETVDSPVSSSGLPIAEALERQVGLRIQQKRRPIAVLVVDHINEKPTEN